MRLSAPEHRLCTTRECPIVYFGADEVFNRGEILVPVFQKEPTATRTVCYCFAVTEADIRRDVDTGRSTARDRISALVKGGRCACEIKNPQGTCCLGNVAAATRAAKAALGSGKRAEESTGHA
jgi:hypothetical protein